MSSRVARNAPEIALAVAALVLAAGRPWSRPPLGQVALAAEVEVPRFTVQPNWPTIPNGWVLGQVASVAADEDDNIWVLHRSRVIRPGQQTGPPVMEFDQSGKYLRGWGGPGSGVPWPQTEHGIYIDHKGFVWIGGSGDEDQILKFTKDGKLVMQIGEGGHSKTNRDTKNFYKPADVFVYPPTNELFVADGYGNRRIIVFDADTGEYKRMWGAFGNVPQDAPPQPPASPGNARRPAKDIPPSDPGPPQFDTVHGVKVSDDGFVYVADRAGKRVQVFGLDGTYVTQAFVDRWCEEPHCGNGQTVASVALSSDPEQRFLYVASRSPARIWIYDRKTLQPLDSFGRPGVAPGEFYVLHHMTTDRAGNLYTSEVQDGRRVQKFVFQGLVKRSTD